MSEEIPDDDVGLRALPLIKVMDTPRGKTVVNIYEHLDQAEMSRHIAGLFAIFLPGARKTGQIKFRDDYLDYMQTYAERLQRELKEAVYQVLSDRVNKKNGK